MKITCISDLHGFYPELTGGDLLIVAGDLTSHDEPEQHEEFCEWLDTRAYRKKIVIAGNHDNNIDADAINSLRNCEYLQGCGNCNRIIGESKENIQTLLNAIEYLKKHSSINCSHVNEYYQPIEIEL